MLLSLALFLRHIMNIKILRSYISGTIAIIAASATIPQLSVIILDEPQYLIPFGLLLS
jgi:hypothetical protein